MANFSRHYFGYFNLSVFGYFCLTLTVESYDCSYRLVAAYVAEKKKQLQLKRKEGYLPLEHHPGEREKPKWEDTITNRMLHWSYTPEQKEEVKKALAAGVPKAMILTYFYPEVTVEKMS